MRVAEKLSPMADLVNECENYTQLYWEKNVGIGKSVVRMIVCGTLEKGRMPIFIEVHFAALDYL